MPHFSRPFQQEPTDSQTAEALKTEASGKWWRGIQNQRKQSSCPQDGRRPSETEFCEEFGCESCGPSNIAPGVTPYKSVPQAKETPIAKIPVRLPLSPPDSNQNSIEEVASGSRGSDPRHAKSHRREKSKEEQEHTRNEANPPPRVPTHILAPKPRRAIQQGLLPSPALAEPERPAESGESLFKFRNPGGEGHTSRNAFSPSYDNIVTQYGHDEELGPTDIVERNISSPRKESAPAVMQNLVTPVRKGMWHVFPHASAGDEERRASESESGWHPEELGHFEPWLKHGPNRSRRNYSIVQSVEELDDAGAVPSHASTVSSSLRSTEGTVHSDASPAQYAKIATSEKPKKIIHSRGASGSSKLSHSETLEDMTKSESPPKAKHDTYHGGFDPQSQHLNQANQYSHHPNSTPSRAPPGKFKKRGHFRSASTLTRCQPGSRVTEASSIDPHMPSHLHQPQRSYSVDENASKDSVSRRALHTTSPGKAAHPSNKSPPHSLPNARRKGTDPPPSSPPRHVAQPFSSNLQSHCHTLEPILASLQTALDTSPSTHLRLESPTIHPLRSPSAPIAPHINHLRAVFPSASPSLLSALLATTIAESFTHAVTRLPWSPTNNPTLLAFLSHIPRSTKPNPNPTTPPRRRSSLTATAAPAHTSPPSASPPPPLPHPPAGSLLGICLPTSDSDSAAYQTALCARARILEQQLGQVSRNLLEAICGVYDVTYRRFLGVLVEVLEGRGEEAGR
ncbi:MAG: hypothetical protein Q9227_004112 [Pyrenula ochraceoflavens]